MGNQKVCGFEVFLILPASPFLEISYKSKTFRSKEDRVMGKRIFEHAAEEKIQQN
jgi:hypothetical protein